MSVTYGQRQTIERFRRVFLNTPDGRKTLGDILTSYGFFASAGQLRQVLAGTPQGVENLVSAIALLESLGVWDDSNFGRLIDAMADLPLPDIEGT